MDLKTYMEKTLNAELLSPSHSHIIPGAVLNVMWEKGTLFYLKKIFSLGIYKKKHSIHAFNGFVYQLFNNENAEDYTSIILPANIALETLTHNLTIKGDIKLPQYGLDVLTTFNKNQKCTIQIEKIQARVFNDPSVTYKIYKLFSEITPENKLYNWLLNDFVVTEAFYATKLCWTFEKGIDIEAIVNYAKSVNIQSTLTYAQKNSQTIEISGEPTVPFAARGFWLEEED